MTDPITPAEAAAAAAIDSVNAATAEQSASGTLVSNEDLLEENPSDEQIAAAAQHARDLETRLANIRARKAGKPAASSQAIPHAVPAAAVPQATDKPAVHVAPAAPVKVAPVQLVNGQVVTPDTEGVVAKPVSHSAKLQEKLSSGYAPPKRKYAYQRNRK